MYKQNLGFIAPFALNLLAYALIYYFFFYTGTENKPASSVNEAPAAYNQHIDDKETVYVLPAQQVKLTAVKN